MKTCPICGRSFEKLLALSRKDNKTMICDDCGTREAANAWMFAFQEEKAEEHQ